MYVSQADEIICVYGLLPEFYTVINLVAHVNKSVPGNFFCFLTRSFIVALPYQNFNTSQPKYDTSFLNSNPEYPSFLFLFFCSIWVYKTIENFESVVAEYALCNQKIFTVHDRYRDFQTPVEEGVNVVKVYIAVAHNA